MRHMDALPRCLVGMEACCGAHHLARELTARDHDAQLMAPQFVKPFLKSNKNDYLDAEAIAEAVQRPTMRFVPAKSVEQLDLQALHRVRERLVSRRTAVINQIRAFLLEGGIVFRAGRVTWRARCRCCSPTSGLLCRRGCAWHFSSCGTSGAA